jgi:hypothetical protein
MPKKLPSKMKGKEKAQKALSAIDRPHLLDDVVLNNLDGTSSYLY